MYSTSADFGRYDPNLKEEVAKESIYCPLAVWGGQDADRPTMRESECLMRLEMNPNCRNNCNDRGQFQNRKRKDCQYYPFCHIHRCFSDSAMLAWAS